MLNLFYCLCYYLSVWQIKANIIEYYLFNIMYIVVANGVYTYLWSLGFGEC